MASTGWLTEGDVKLEQLCVIAEGNWATEWERALLGRNGQTTSHPPMFDPASSKPARDRIG